MNLQIDRAIAKLLRSLNNSQTFHTSLILLCLKEIQPSIKSKRVVDAGLTYLLKESREKWTWNYWNKDVDKHVPDDWDDTSLALAAISLYKSGLIDGEAWAAITKTLISCEVAEGGPYSTWIVPKELKEKWIDVDVAVNANIGYFLSLHDIHLPKLDKLAEDFIDGKTAKSKYYFNDLVTFYFISRFYNGPRASRAVQRILKKRKNGKWKDVQDTALAVSSLINFGYPSLKLEKAVTCLLKQSETPESIPSIPLYIEEIVNGKPIYSGSPALVSAFVIEALNKYQRAIELKEKEKPILPKNNEDEITQLPYYFRQSLIEKLRKNKRLSDLLMKELGRANLLGWKAYKIYDDFLDNEGQPEILPEANKYLRELTIIYKDVLPPEHFPTFTEIMDKMEDANHWERLNCHFSPSSAVQPLMAGKELPNYGNYDILAYKSLPHAIGPITILHLLGYKRTSPEIENLILYFHHYIIARQLNDDAHDWLEDLRRGFVNSVSVKVLKIWQKSEEFNADKKLSDTEKDLQSIFWNEIIQVICKEIRSHLKSARKALQKISIIQNSSYLESLLLPIENSAKKALSEQLKTKSFLKNY